MEDFVWGLNDDIEIVTIKSRNEQNQMIVQNNLICSVFCIILHEDLPIWHHDLIVIYEKNYYINSVISVQ